MAGDVKHDNHVIPVIRTYRQQLFLCPVCKGIKQQDPYDGCSLVFLHCFSVATKRVLAVSPLFAVNERFTALQA